MHRLPTAALVAAFLSSLVAANLLVAHDPSFVYVNALVLIGLDLTTRDVLHDRWGSRRWLYMGALVVAGALIAYLLNSDAQRVGIASAAAFTAAFLVDAVVYAGVWWRPWLERVTISNVPSSIVDSIVFPWIAFSGLDWKVAAGLAGCKIGGGCVWGIVLERFAWAGTYDGDPPTLREAIDADLGRTG